MSKICIQFIIDILLWRHIKTDLVFCFKFSIPWAIFFMDRECWSIAPLLNADVTLFGDFTNAGAKWTTHSISHFTQKFYKFGKCQPLSKSFESFNDAVICFWSVIGRRCVAGHTFVPSWIVPIKSCLNILINFVFILFRCQYQLVKAFSKVVWRETREAKPSNVKM